MPQQARSLLLAQPKLQLRLQLRLLHLLLRLQLRLLQWLLLQLLLPKAWLQILSKLRRRSWLRRSHEARTRWTHAADALLQTIRLHWC